jgi:hypothetical protein
MKVLENEEWWELYALHHIAVYTNNVYLLRENIKIIQVFWPANKETGPKVNICN